MLSNSNLETYILKRYGFWVKWCDASAELLFDIESCIGSYIESQRSIPNMEMRNWSGKAIDPSNTESDVKSHHIPVGGVYSPKLFPYEFIHREYAISFGDIDFRNDGIKYTLLAKLILLNVHLDIQGEQS